MNTAQTDVLELAPRTRDGFRRDEVIEMALELGITAEELTPPRPRIVNDSALSRVVAKRDGSNVLLRKFQDAKYGVYDELSTDVAYLANLETGEIIPRDEPTFILRAQDKYAIGAIQEYCRLVTADGTAGNEMTGPTAHAAVEAFSQFRDAHPRRMKRPD